jgi:hypothetical protein
VATVDSNGRTIFVADAHRGDGKRFVVHADEKLTAFMELESAIRLYRRNPRDLRLNDFSFPSKNSIDTVQRRPARSARAKSVRRLQSSHLTLLPQDKPRAQVSLALEMVVMKTAANYLIYFSPAKQAVRGAGAPGCDCARADFFAFFTQRKQIQPKTMKTLHSLMAGLRPAFPNVVNRIAIPSLVVAAALAFVQPCAGLSFEFRETDSLAMVHSNAPATLLASGRVLIAGGGSPIADAELYTPRRGTWSATGSLNAARRSHTATLLPNGQVLVAGGADSGGLITSTELHDPTTGTWSVTGSLAEARSEHSATLLADGRVLVAGGFTQFGEGTRSAEIYDPASGIWSATGSLHDDRGVHTATLLQNGQVLVAGGTGSSGDHDSAELYDPASGTWSFTGSLSVEVYAHAATLLPNGAVLVTGGTVSPAAFSTHSELYDPRNGTWTVTGSLNVGRRDHTSILLRNGRVLIVAGATFPASESARTELGGRVRQ